QPPAGEGDAPPPPAEPTEGGVHLRDMPAGPEEYVTYQVDKAIKDLLPDVPRVSSEVRPMVAKAVGSTYGYITDRPIQKDLNWSFWLGVLLFMITGLSWLSHGSRRTSRRKTLELAPGAG